MVFSTVAGLVVASLALAAALGLSFWARSGGELRYKAIEYILNKADADDLAVLEFFMHLREVDLLLLEGTDEE